MFASWSFRGCSLEMACETAACGGDIDDGLGGPFHQQVQSGSYNTEGTQHIDLERVEQRVQGSASSIAVRSTPAAVGNRPSLSVLTSQGSRFLMHNVQISNDIGFPSFQISTMAALHSDQHAIAMALSLFAWRLGSYGPTRAFTHRIGRCHLYH